MPADASEQIRRLPSGKWQLRYYDRKGCATPVARSRPSQPPGRTTATWSNPAQRQAGRPTRPDATPTSSRCSSSGTRSSRSPRTITELRWRLKQSEAEVRDGAARRAGGDGRRDRRVSQSTLPERYRYPLDGGVPADVRGRRPLRLHDPEPGEARGPESDAGAREIRVFTAEELKAITAELGHRRGGRGHVRRRDRAATRGVGVDRTARRRQGSQGAAACAAPRRSGRGARCR